MFIPKNLPKICKRRAACSLFWRNYTYTTTRTQLHVNNYIYSDWSRVVRGSCVVLHTQMCGVRVEYDDVVTADEAGDVCQVVDCVEAETKASDLLRLPKLCGTRQLDYGLKVGVREHGIVINPQRWTLTLSHPCVKEEGTTSHLWQQNNCLGTGIGKRSMVHFHPINKLTTNMEKAF